MNTGLNHGSAKIFQFPAGGRQALGGRRPDAIKSTLEPGSTIEAACSGSWYHEAAVQEAKPAWER